MSNKLHFFNSITGLFFVLGKNFVSEDVGDSYELHDTNLTAVIQHTFEGCTPCAAPLRYRGCIVARLVSNGAAGRFRVFVPADNCLEQTESGVGYCPGADNVKACKALVDFYIAQGWVKKLQPVYQEKLVRLPCVNLPARSSRTNTFAHLLALCSGKGILCERNGRTIELEAPGSGTTVICNSVSEALEEYRTEPLFTKLPIKIYGRAVTI